MISPLAISPTVFGRQLYQRQARSTPVYGVMLHTTGSALPGRITKTADATLAEAVDHYSRTGGPHYVIGWDGRIVATTDERSRGAHAGIGEPDVRSAYTNNTWRNRVSPQGVALWETLWPGYRSPRDLIPSRNYGNINDYWIGVEMIPITDGSRYWATPAFPGARFTAAQHKAAQKLAHDIAERYSFPTGWSKKGSPRLLGHSDIDPITRDTNSQPLWDPGYANGSFDLDRVRSGNYTWLWMGLFAAGAGLLVARWIR